MSRIVFGFLLICLFAMTAEAKTGYAVMAPKFAVADEEYLVNVLLTREASDSNVKNVTLKASFNVSEIGAKTTSVQFADRILGTYASLIFSIPRSLIDRLSDESNSGVLLLTVSASGDIVFEKVIAVLLQSMQGQIYFQMDKPIYRAGDKIRFLAFGMYNNFVPITDRSLNISIHDPNGNLVQRWVNVRNLTSNGVVQCEMPLSSKAPLGLWRASLSFGTVSGYYDFPVEDYTLTYFEAVIDTNSTYFARFDSNNAVLVVSEGRYQAQGCTTQQNCDLVERGQVTGSVYMEIWVLGANGTKHGSIKVTQQVSPGFPIHYVISANELSRIAELHQIETIFIQSKVTEALTGLESFTNKTIPVINHRYMLEYLNAINPTVFHRDRNLQIELQTVKADGTLYTKNDSSYLRYEKAASCDKSELQNRDSFRDLPSHSQHNSASNGAIKYLVDTSQDEMECETLYVRTDLLLKSGDSLLDSIIKSYSRYSARATIKAEWTNGKIEVPQKKLNDYLSFSIAAGSAVPALHWMVVSRGQVFDVGFVAQPETQRATFGLYVNRDHLPRATIIVWTTLNDELVADTLEFTVADTTLSLEYSTGASPQTDNFGQNATTNVQAPIALRFTTSPGSFVHWLAIDEKVLIHQRSRLSSGTVDQSEQQAAGTDVNNDFVPTSERTLNDNFLDVAQQMNEHLASLAGGSVNSAGNTYDVFQHSNILLETSYVNTHGLPKARSAAVPTGRNVPTENSVRTIFPEVFLFQNDIAPSSGQFVTRHKTPQVMTTWYVAALSLHATKGLAVSNVVQIPVYHDFYLSIYIPSLIYKCNETVNATVYAHNTRAQGINTVVTMTGQSGFKIDGQPNLVSVSKRIIVPAQSSFLTTFLVQFVSVESHKVIVSAVTDDGRSDAVQTIVNVKPEGVHVLETTQPVFCTQSETKCTQHIVLEPKHEACTQAVLGEATFVVTPMFAMTEDISESNPNNLPNPGGCCEQAMRGFIDLTYLLRTLRISNSSSADVESVATQRLQQSLQKYLRSCARADGAVTSWNDPFSNTRGSTVLTGFVARSLTIAGHLLQDSGALEQAERNVRWLISVQESDGSLPAFPGKGSYNVWYAQLETGYFQNVTSTAYALIGILEHETTGVKNVQLYAQQLLRASLYLQQKNVLQLTSDVHYLSIVGYALHLSAVRLRDNGAQSAASAIMTKLQSRLFHSGSRTFWPYNRDASSSSMVLSGAVSASTIEVETASFMLEAFLLQHRIDSSIPLASTSDAASLTWIFYFLMSQRNAQHQLPRLSASTHSSAIGQMAIGDYVLEAKVPFVQSGTILVESTRGTNYTHAVAVTEGTVNPIEVTLPFGVDEVRVTSTAGLTQVHFSTLKYYLNPYHAYHSYHSGVIDTHVFAAPTTNDRSFATIRICNSWLRSENSGMVVSLVELQSGYALHSTEKDIKKQHPIQGGGSIVGSLEILDDRNFAIYYDFLPSFETICTEALLRRAVNVETLATAAVRTYNYYNPQYIAFELYKITMEAHVPKSYRHMEFQCFVKLF